MKKKTKRIIVGSAALLIVLSILLACTGCASNQTENSVVKDEPSMFVVVEKADCWTVVYHKDTKVMYAISCGAYNRGNFTLLVNADGTPMIWEG